ncbi:MAG: hypothetical protein AAB589_02370 [Patescibacteria group bacterium]
MTLPAAIELDRLQQAIIEQGGKWMYGVERFVPNCCPGCERRFERQQNWIIYADDLKPGNRRDYEIIQCADCGNRTMRKVLETYQLSDKEKARALLQKGFCNLQKVPALGTMTKDHRTDEYGQIHWL